MAKINKNGRKEMKRAYGLSVCYLLLLFSSVNARATMVIYDLNSLSSGQYEYNYTIINDKLAISIEEFTIWFDVDLCKNLVITTPDPLASQWDQIILKDTGFGLPLGYDALALSGGIPPGQMIDGFSVKFDWLGTQTPGPQYFEIVNPRTFETIDSGYTVPEPTTFLLIGFGGLALLIKRRA
jgi:hypothetical protein